MSKKCVKCGKLLPEKASFCPHCTAVQTEKQEVKAPGRWKKKVVTGAVLAVLAAAVGMAFSQYHRPRSYEGGAQIIYPNEEKSYKVLLTFSEGDGVAGQAEKERTDRISSTSTFSPSLRMTHCTLNLYFRSVSAIFFITINGTFT